MTRSRRAIAASIAVAALLATAACSGSDKPKKSPSATPTSTATPTPTPTPTPPAPPAKNPYTGIGAVPTTPTVAVKIDDTGPGRPQRNIDQADIVYIEAVEGGLTRLAAIFGTHKPGSVGYVRSTRPSDPDLLLQYGKITAAYSGGAHDSLPLMAKSGLTRWSNDAGAAYYARASHPGDEGYINLVLDVAKVAKKTKSAKPKPIGWTFNPSLTGLPVAVGTDVRTYVRGSISNRSGGTPVQFKWDTKLKKYVRYIDGQRQVASDGKAVSATNVIVQFCKVVAHPQDTDVNGNPSQFTYTVGSGPVSVFRQGKRINGTWTRSKVTNGTTFKTAAGKVLPLNPGNTWVVLATKGTALSG
jgi:Protein of unknown function (DUF3048) C-terminal domain/Protein of unknown function (DUF3048) N-terminal domain